MDIKLDARRNSDYTGDLCARHENQQLCLFCNRCEMLICVKCWFLEEHAGHKEHTQPLEEAFESHKRKMTEALAPLAVVKKRIEEDIEFIEEVEKVLADGRAWMEYRQNVKKKLDDFFKDLELFGTCEATPGSMRRMLFIYRAVKDLPEIETVLPRVDRRCKEFVTEPTVLVFQMVEFNKGIKRHGSVETTVQVDGFEWKCKIQDEDGTPVFYLCLTEGKPSECSVRFDNGPERVYRFELGKAVRIGTYKPAINVDNGAHLLTAYIRQQHADRIRQLEDYIAQLKW